MKRPTLAALGIACGLAHACAQPECITINYADAECRVIAENEHARLRTASGAEVRFLTAGARTLTAWDATGLLAQEADGTVAARVAGLGQFTLAIRRDVDGPDAVPVVLRNVDARATVRVGPDGEGSVIDAGPAGATERTVTVPLPNTEPVFIEGELACPSRFRLVLAADIQTNPDQFARIVEAMRAEWAESLDTDEPLVGLLIPGDITEASRDEEFARIHEILAALPFPVAMTPGNHDIYRPNRPHFTGNFGPGNHAFTVCRTHVTLLDSGSGSLAPSVEARLPALLDPAGASFSVLGVHHPPYAGWTGAGFSQEDQAARLLVEAALAGVDLVVAGHSHALVEFPDVPVGDVRMREIISGTAGAYQGVGPPRYGYVRLTFGTSIEACFVEVTPPGFSDSPNDEPQLGHCP